MSDFELIPVLPRERRLILTLIQQEHRRLQRLQVKASAQNDRYGAALWDRNLDELRELIVRVRDANGADGPDGESRPR